MDELIDQPTMLLFRSPDYPGAPLIPANAETFAFIEENEWRDDRCGVEDKYLR